MIFSCTFNQLGNVFLHFLNFILLWIISFSSLSFFTFFISKTREEKEAAYEGKTSKRRIVRKLKNNKAISFTKFKNKVVIRM